MNNTAASTNGGKKLAVIQQPPPPAVIDAGALLAQGIQQGLSVDAMERLLGMRRELQEEQAAGAFAAALASFQADLPPIAKSQTARIQSQRGTFSYKYADLADIQRAIGPRLASCGLAVTFDTEEQGDRLDVICRVHHIQGHSSEARFPVPVDRTARMNAAQQVGAALTYGRRYALTAALGIVTADEDNDAQGVDPAGSPHTRPATAATPPAAAPNRTPPTPGAGPPPAQGTGGTKGGTSQTEAQHRRLETRINALGLAPYRERIKAWTEKRWGVTSLADLTSDQNQALYDHLDDFAERIAIETEQASH